MNQAVYTLRKKSQQELLAEAAAVAQQIERAEAVRAEIAADPTASATLATAGGTQSYTRANASDLDALIRALKVRYGNLLMAAAPSRNRGPRFGRISTRFR